MSNPNGPVRRRRIAGESKPAVEPAESKRKLIPKAPKKIGIPKPSVAPSSAAPPSRPAAAAGSSVAAKVSSPPAPRRARVSLPPRSEWRWFIPVTLLAIAAIVFGAVFAVRGVSDYRQERGIDEAGSQAASAAGKAAETIFTYRYDKLPEHLANSKELMTPAFQKEFESLAPALTELAPQRKINVMGQTRSAATVVCGNDCSANKASILVFLDQARLVDDSKTPTVFGQRMVIEMVKLNGTWLVNEIKAL